MKRVTIAMDDDLYKDLLGYAADQSKLNVRRLSIGEAVRTLINQQLEIIGYGRSTREETSSRESRLNQTPYLARERS